MKLRYKLILGFLFTALLVAVVGYVSHSLNRNIRDRLVQINTRSIFLMEYTGEMAMALHNSLMYTREYLDEQYRLATTDDLKPEQRKEIRFAAEEAKKLVQEQLGRFKKYMSESRELARKMDEIEDSENIVGRDTVYEETLEGRLDIFREKFNIYESLLLEMFKISEGGYQDGQELLSVTLEPFFKTTLIPLIDKMRTRAHLRVDRETSRLEQQLDFALQTTLFVGLLAMVTAMGLGYAIYRQISDPLNKLTKSARKIGEGELEERIGIDSNDEIGTLATTFNKMVENLDETTVSKNYFNNIIESLSDGLVVVDSDFNILKVNRALTDLSGYNQDSLHRMVVISLFKESERDRIQKQLEQASTADVDYIETILLTNKGDEIQVSFIASPLTARYEQNGYVCLISDITERKKAEEQIEKSLEEKKVLLAEIHHRVKNNLAVISSLLQMQLHNTQNDTVYSLLQDSVLRIQSIALIHEKLYQSDTLAFIEYDKYLEDLVSTIEDSFVDESKQIMLELNFSPVSLNINQAIPCSLFINEVLVNCFKHAFDGQKEGCIKVSMEEASGSVQLEIRDNGEGMPDDFDPEESDSLGMTLIHTLTKQLSGELSIYNEGGAVYELTFPME